MLVSFELWTTGECKNNHVGKPSLSLSKYRTH